MDGFRWWRWRRLAPLGVVLLPTVLAVWLLAGRPTAAAQGDVAAQGRELFLTGCSSCHGADGKGSVVRDSLPAIPDFTARAWQESRTDPQLVVSILEGKGADMPAFQDKLAREQARDLVAFLRAFAPGTTQPAGAASDDFEARFRQLMEEFQGLQRQRESLSPPSSQPKSKGVAPRRSTASSPTGRRP